MSAQLKNRGYQVGRRKARRYMNEMDIHPIYPKMNLSKRMQQAKVCAYYGQRAELIRAIGAAVRSKRRKPSYVTWDFSYFYHSVQADKLYGSFYPNKHQRRCCLRTAHTMS